MNYREQTHNTTFLALNITTNSLSILGALFFIFMFLKFKELRKFNLKIIFYLSIADLIWSLSRLYDYQLNQDQAFVEQPGGLCIVQAFTETFGGLSSIAWTVVISYTVKITVIDGIQDVLVYEIKFLIFAIFLPLVCAFIPLITQDYGVSDISCWIKQNNDDKIRTILFQMFFFYIPLWIAVIFNIWMYFTVFFYMRKLDKDSAVYYMSKRILYYPFVLIICWIWGTIYKIHRATSDDEILWLAGMHIFFGGLMGFINFIVYGCTKNVIIVIKQKLCFVCFGSQIKQQQTQKPIETELISKPLNNQQQKLVKQETIETESYNGSRTVSILHNIAL